MMCEDSYSSLGFYVVNKTRSCCMLSFTGLHQASVSLTQCTQCTHMLAHGTDLIWACCHFLSQHVSHWSSLRLSGYQSVCFPSSKTATIAKYVFELIFTKTYSSQVEIIPLHHSSCPAEWLFRMGTSVYLSANTHKHVCLPLVWCTGGRKPFTLSFGGESVRLSVNRNMDGVVGQEHSTPFPKHTNTEKQRRYPHIKTPQRVSCGPICSVLCPLSKTELKIDAKSFRLISQLVFISWSMFLILLTAGGATFTHPHWQPLCQHFIHTTRLLESHTVIPLLMLLLL